MHHAHALSRPLFLFSVAMILVVSSGCSTPSTLAHQSVQEARVLDDFRLEGRIDGSTFRDAAGLVVLEVGRGGLGIGLTVGHGVAVRRLEDRWSPPLPLDIVSGSVGFQIGGEGGRLIMVFEDTESFENFVFDGTQFLAEASGTAWNATGAAGNPLDRAKVEVISSIGGLYGGAVIGGFGVTIDKSMMRKGYGQDVTPRQVLDDRDVLIPAGAATLWKSIDG